MLRFLPTYILLAHSRATGLAHHDRWTAAADTDKPLEGRLLRGQLECRNAAASLFKRAASKKTKEYLRRIVVETATA